MCRRALSSHSHPVGNVVALHCFYWVGQVLRMSACCLSFEVLVGRAGGSDGAVRL